MSLVVVLFFRRLNSATHGYCRYNTLFYVEMRRNPVFTKTYTVNVCFWRLGWRICWMGRISVSYARKIGFWRIIYMHAFWKCKVVLFVRRLMRSGWYIWAEGPITREVPSLSVPPSLHYGGQILLRGHKVALSAPERDSAPRWPVTVTTSPRATRIQRGAPGVRGNLSEAPRFLDGGAAKETRSTTGAVACKPLHPQGESIRFPVFFVIDRLIDWLIDW